MAEKLVSWNVNGLRACEKKGFTKWFASEDAEVVCLQEVSGDQLASLRAALSPAAQVFVLRYPRLPRSRTTPTADATLLDPTEHLVTVIVGDYRVRGVDATVFADDGGKGFIAVELASGPAVINTHVTFGDKRDPQLRQLAAAARAIPGASIIAGDFNADRATVGAILGGELEIAIPTEPAIPTRPRATGQSRPQTIDHVIVRAERCGDCTVVDVDGLSDHTLVTVRIG